MVEGVHVCVNCGAKYTSEELRNMRYCKVCGGTAFVFKSKGPSKDGSISNTTVYLPSDIKVLDEGVFEVNIASLATKDPVVIEGDDGVFFIKFPRRK